MVGGNSWPVIANWLFDRKTRVERDAAKFESAGRLIKILFIRNYHIPRRDYRKSEFRRGTLSAGSGIDRDKRDQGIGVSFRAIYRRTIDPCTRETSQTWLRRKRERGEGGRRVNRRRWQTRNKVEDTGVRRGSRRIRGKWNFVKPPPGRPAPIIQRSRSTWTMGIFRWG